MEEIFDMGTPPLSTVFYCADGLYLLVGIRAGRSQFLSLYEVDEFRPLAHESNGLWVFWRFYQAPSTDVVFQRCLPACAGYIALSASSGDASTLQPSPATCADGIDGGGIDDLWVEQFRLGYSRF